MATRLTEFDIEEVSGVANPANQLPGFMVIKSAGEAEALLKDVDELEQDYAILFAALETCKPHMAEAPPEVQAAADTLMTYVESLFDEEGAEDAAPAPNEGAPPTSPVALSAGDEEPKTILARILHSRTTKATQGAKPTTQEKEPVAQEDTKNAGELAKAARRARVEKREEERRVFVDTLKGIGTAMEALIDSVEELKKGQADLAATDDVLKEALSATLDRVGKAEAQPASPLTHAPAATVTKSATDGLSAGRQALRAGLVQLAQNPGSSLTLGQGE